MYHVASGSMRCLEEESGESEGEEAEKSGERVAKRRHSERRSTVDEAGRREQVLRKHPLAVHVTIKCKGKHPLAVHITIKCKGKHSLVL